MNTEPCNQAADNKQKTENSTSAENAGEDTLGNTEGLPADSKPASAAADEQERETEHHEPGLDLEFTCPPEVGDISTIRTWNHVIK